MYEMCYRWTNRLAAICTSLSVFCWCFSQYVCTDDRHHHICVLFFRFWFCFSLLHWNRIFIKFFSIQLFLFVSFVNLIYILKEDILFTILFPYRKFRWTVRLRIVRRIWARVNILLRFLFVFDFFFFFAVHIDV